MRIRQALAQREPKITQTQIDRYYAQNKQRYERPERRSIAIVEHLPTEDAARAVLRTAKLRKKLPRSAIQESLDEPNLAEVIPEKKATVKAIFTAKPHVLVGPVMLNNLYAVFEVTHIKPSTRQPLNEVESSIEQQLATEQQRRVLAGFIAAWRQRWRAQTDCNPGYVVERCRQYNGTKAPENPYTFS
jgi:PPIC-type PPIASE domain